MWAAARLSIPGESPLNDFLSLLNLEAIKNVSVKDLRLWHSKTIVRDGVTIAVTGAINRKDAGRAVDQLLLGLPKGKALNVADAQPNFTPKTILLHLPDAEKTTPGLPGQLPPISEGSDLTDLLALSASCDDDKTSSITGPLDDFNGWAWLHVQQVTKYFVSRINTISEEV